MQAHFEGEGGPFSLLEAVECPCWCVWSCLERTRRPLRSRGPVWMALLPLPRHGRNIEFAWLWMCQKNSNMFCSGDPEASYKGGRRAVTSAKMFLKLEFLGCDCGPSQSWSSWWKQWEKVMGWRGWGRLPRYQKPARLSSISCEIES